MAEVEQVAYIISRAFDCLKLEKYVKEFVRRFKDKFKHSSAELSGPVALRRRNSKFDFNRSPHVDKKSREQFEQRTSGRLIVLHGLTPAMMQMLGDSSFFPPPPPGVEIYLKIKRVKFRKEK
ncbi:30S ribosomal protein S10 [Wolbachia endosymbiont of Brugia malayi]|uniref:30S ribosomal protein S10 n=1 Tax=unclassified Wolbachia TaxID=2640676 RepID=UPI00004C9364|nr:MULTISPECIES: 30S ribosomal protein S10 [unclassified Wolbachia]AAW70931.1 Ribosomal protein S10 [Wolbachia endosymbiont strain TRS of Brugia malayi]QCB61888.1 30S ribosomal protein S10 [Wolbachia endosymbiont of Brugia malayi]QIT36197.1 ribosomal S10p/S20e family protein [Wolbachia endosymbiont of Brugia pahangi]